MNKSKVLNDLCSSGEVLQSISIRMQDVVDAPLNKVEVYTFANLSAIPVKKYRPLGLSMPSFNHEGDDVPTVLREYAKQLLALADEAEVLQDELKKRGLLG